MRRALATLTLAALVLGGCGGGGSGPRPARASAADGAAAKPPGAPRPKVALVPDVMAPAGLDGVIGAPAAALTRRFGSPRIDLAEGDARKLQFAGAACVLDIYLYPLSASAPEPTATHVEARLRQGGAPTDPGACIDEVERR